MAIIDGQEVTFEVSTDEDPTNYVDLTADLLGPIRLNRGRRSVDRESGADSHVGRTAIKGQPSLTARFRTNSNAGGSWTVLANGGQLRAFRYTLADTRMTGVAVFDDDDDTFDNATALGDFSVTLRPATGQAAWATSQVV